MAVPMLNKSEVYGFIYVDSLISSRLFDDEDLRVLTMLANIAAIQIENARLFAEQVEKRRFEGEVEAAAQIQRRLLPRRPPAVPGYLFDGRNSPCYDVGGDYWDCLTVEGSMRAVVLGDVAGKGMGAALLMAGLQATFHARVETKPGLIELIDYLNGAIAVRAPSNRFVTLFLMMLDSAGHRLTCVNAGHAPMPLIVRADGRMEEIESGGPPLGVVPGYAYGTRSIELEPGDTIFSCSDGVTDAVNADGDAFGERRLRDVIGAMAGHPPHEMCEALDDQLSRFVGDAGQTDDLTIVAVQRET
jgi:serine phosphatase RsbU (regulator of sigma subunit)